MCRLWNIALRVWQMDRQTDRQTDGRTDRRRTKWSLCVAMLRRRHKNTTEIYRRKSSNQTYFKGNFARTILKWKIFMIVLDWKSDCFRRLNCMYIENIMWQIVIRKSIVCTDSYNNYVLQLMYRSRSHRCKYCQMFRERQLLPSIKSLCPTLHYKWRCVREDFRKYHSNSEIFLTNDYHMEWRP